MRLITASQNLLICPDGALVKFKFFFHAKKFYPFFLFHYKEFFDILTTFKLLLFFISLELDCFHGLQTFASFPVSLYIIYNCADRNNKMWCHSSDGHVN